MAAEKNSLTSLIPKDTGTMEEDLRRDTESAFDRLSLVVIPMLWLVRFLCCLDRCNLVFAALQMRQDLGFSDKVYGLGAGMYCIGVACVQLPSTLVLGHVSAPLWLGAQCLAFGAVSMCFSLVRTATEFYILRFLLGFAEAGVFPCIWYYMTQLYPDHHLPEVFSIVVTANLASHVMAPPLAAASLSMDGHLGTKGWQWIFIVQGIPSLFLGLLLPLLLPSSPHTSTWLSPADKALIREASSRCAPAADCCDEDTTAVLPTTSEHSDAPDLHTPRSPAESTGRKIRQALCQSHLWFMGGLRMVGETVSSGLVTFLPAILNFLFDGTEISTNQPQHNHGVHVDISSEDGKVRAARLGIFVVLMASVPFTLPVVFGICLAGSAERRQEFTYHTVVPYLISGTCLLFVPYAYSTFLPASFYLLIIGCIAPLGANVPLLALFTVVTPRRLRLVTLPLFDTIQVIGGFIGPLLMARLLVPNTNLGQAAYVMGSLLIVYGGLALGLKRFERRLGDISPQDVMMAPVCH